MLLQSLLLILSLQSFGISSADDENAGTISNTETQQQLLGIQQQNGADRPPSEYFLGYPFVKIDQDEQASIRNFLDGLQSGVTGDENHLTNEGLTEQYSPNRKESQANLPKVGDPFAENSGYNFGQLPAEESQEVKEISEEELAMKQTDHRGRSKDAKKAEAELSKMFHGMMKEWARGWGKEGMIGRLGEMEERVRERVRMEGGRMQGENEGERMITGAEGELTEITKKPGKGVGDKMEKEGERVVTGDQGVLKESMEEREKAIGDTMGKERDGEMMAIGDKGDTMNKEREGEWVKTANQGEMKEMTEREKMESERLKKDEEGERMIAGTQNWEERMRERKRHKGDIKEGEGERVVRRKNKDRVDETVVGDQAQGHVRFENQEWLPSWILVNKSKSERKENKIGNVLYLEMKKEIKK